MSDDQIVPKNTNSVKLTPAQKEILKAIDEGKIVGTSADGSSWGVRSEKITWQANRSFNSKTVQGLIQSGILVVEFDADTKDAWARRVLRRPALAPQPTAPLRYATLQDAIDASDAQYVEEMATQGYDAELVASTVLSAPSVDLCEVCHKKPREFVINSKNGAYSIGVCSPECADNEPETDWLAQDYSGMHPDVVRAQSLLAAHAVPVRVPQDNDGLIVVGDTILNTLDGGEYTVRSITAGGRLMLGNGTVGIEPMYAKLVRRAFTDPAATARATEAPDPGRYVASFTETRSTFRLSGHECQRVELTFRADDDEESVISVERQWIVDGYEVWTYIRKSTAFSADELPRFAMAMQRAVAIADALRNDADGANGAA